LRTIKYGRKKFGRPKDLKEFSADHKIASFFYIIDHFYNKFAKKRGTLFILADQTKNLCGL
jgi:hypothetical protein